LPHPENKELILDRLEIPFDPDKQALRWEKTKQRHLEGIPPRLSKPRVKAVEVKPKRPRGRDRKKPTDARQLRTRRADKKGPPHFFVKRRWEGV
jgi:hypothetical protein